MGCFAAPIIAAPLPSGSDVGKHATEVLGCKKVFRTSPCVVDVVETLTCENLSGSCDRALIASKTSFSNSAPFIMRLRYEITIDDLLAFTLHVHQTSPTMRCGRSLAVLTLATVILSICIIAWKITGNRIILWSGFGWAGLIVAIYPRLYRRNVKRLSSRLYAEGQNKGILGQHVAELRDNGLSDTTDFAERTVFWKGIEKIESISGHTFVYLSAMSAHVIPEESVTEGNYRTFVEELQHRWRRAHSE